MKKLLLTISLMVAVCFANASNSADFFRIDEQKVVTEMADLSAIESYVNNHDVTLSQLYAENNELALSALSPSYGASSMDDGPPLGIPSFVWGFCLGCIGILVVYLVTDSRDESMKAFWGCVVGAVVSIVFQLIVGGFSTTY